MKIINGIRYALGFAIVAGATIAIGATAEARSVGGTSGQAGPDAQSVCFQPQSNGAILSVAAAGCNASPQFCVPLVVDEPTNSPLIAVLQPAGAGVMGCFATTATSEGVTTSTAKLNAPNSGFAEINLGQVSVSNAGSLFVCCDMPPTTEIITVNW
jgi:hypothetical protein